MITSPLTRRLVEKLPKETVAGGDDSAGPNAVFWRSVASEITRRLKMSWAPPVSKPKGVCWRGTPPVWHLEVSGVPRVYRLVLFLFSRFIYITFPCVTDFAGSKEHIRLSVHANLSQQRSRG